MSRTSRSSVKISVPSTEHQPNIDINFFSSRSLPFLPVHIASITSEMDRSPVEILDEVCSYLYPSRHIPKFRLVNEICGDVGLKHLVSIVGFFIEKQRLDRLDDLANDSRLSKHVQHLFYDVSVLEHQKVMEYPQWKRLAIHLLELKRRQMSATPYPFTEMVGSRCGRTTDSCVETSGVCFPRDWTNRSFTRHFQCSLVFKRLPSLQIVHIPGQTKILEMRIPSNILL